jgi:hypothetical protein
LSNWLGNAASGSGLACIESCGDAFTGGAEIDDPSANRLNTNIAFEAKKLFLKSLYLPLESFHGMLSPLSI